MTLPDSCSASDYRPNVIWKVCWNNKRQTIDGIDLVQRFLSAISTTSVVIYCLLADYDMNVDINVSTIAGIYLPLLLLFKYNMQPSYTCGVLHLSLCP